MPTAAELEAGKRYSCAPCGYGASNGFCLYADLPSVSFDMVLRGATADVAMRIGRDQRPATMVERFDDVREIWAGRRGRRRSDRSRGNGESSVGRYTDTAVKFETQHAYQYAQMFGGELAGCEVFEEPCAWDLGAACVTVRCASGDVDCPPAGLDECPGHVYDPCKFK